MMLPTTMPRLRKAALYQVEQSLERAARDESIGDTRSARNHALAAAAWQAFGSLAPSCQRSPAARPSLPASRGRVSAVQRMMAAAAGR